LESRGFDYHEAMDAIIDHGSYGNAMAWIVNHPRRKSVAYKIGFKKATRYPRRTASAKNDLVVPSSVVHGLVHSPVHLVTKKTTSKKATPDSKNGRMKELREQRRNSDSMVTDSIRMMGGVGKKRSRLSPVEDEKDFEVKEESGVISKRNSLVEMNSGVISKRHSLVDMDSGVISKRNSLMDIDSGKLSSKPNSFSALDELDSAQTQHRKSVKNILSDAPFSKKRGSVQGLFVDQAALKAALESIPSDKVSESNFEEVVKRRRSSGLPMVGDFVQEGKHVRSQ